MTPRRALMMRFLAILTALLPLAAGRLPAQTVTGYSHDPVPGYVHTNDRFGNYPGGYFTPRIEWARPLATGRIKVLAFLPLEAAREAVELASRLDAQVDIVTPSGHDVWFKGREGDFYNSIPSAAELNARAARLLSSAYRHHAIVIGKLKWSSIPADVRDRILAKVRAGSALVFVTPWDIEPDLLEKMQLDDGANPLAATVKATVPLKQVGFEADLEASYAAPFQPRSIGPTVIRTGKLGEGTVVLLDYNDLLCKDGKRTALQEPWRNLTQTCGLTLFAEDDDLFYDYAYSVLAKAIIAATGRESAATVRPDAVSATIDRGKLPAAPVAFTATLGGRVGEGTSLVYEIRDRRNAVVAGGQEDIGGKPSPVTLAPSLPVSPQGLYVVDVWIKRGGVVLDWASAAVTVGGASCLEAVATDKEQFARDEGIAGTVRLRGPLPSGSAVVVELWDTWNRLEQRVSLEPGVGQFRFAAIKHPLSRHYRVVARVTAGGSVVEERETSVGLPSNRFDDFQFLLWYGVGNNRPSKTAMRLFKTLGVTAYDHGAFGYFPERLLRQWADILARNDVFSWTYAASMCGFKVDPQFGDWEKGTFWGKEVVRRAWTKVCGAFGRYGSLAYCVDSEGYVAREEKDWDNPTAKKDFGLYLQERYGDIAKLNAVWGSAFKNFDEIGFISFIDAKTGRKYTQWLETNLYKIDRFNRVPEYAAGLIRELDPGARVALSITHDDYDLPRMAKFIDGFTQSGLEDFDKEKFRLQGTYFGYYFGTLSEWHMRVFPWERLFRGDNQVNWWTGVWSLTYDLSEPTLGFKQTSEEILEIQRGPGKLLMSATKRVDPILVLRSTPSRFAAVLHPVGIGWDQARDNFTNMLHRTGLDYRFVSEAFLQNELEFSEAQRVLILPASQSISREGVARIKAFARAGGLVIADFMPAVVDEYLRPYGEPAKAAAGEPKFETCPKCAGKKVIHLGGLGNPLGPCPRCGGTGMVSQGDEKPGQSLLADLFDASAKGVKPFGKGFGFFLAGAPIRDEWAAIRATLVGKAGIRGDVQVVDTLGNLRTDLRTFVFDDGGAMLVGVAPDMSVANPPGPEFVLQTARPWHVYNVRRQAYLGRSDAVTAGISAVEAKLFALLPERITGLGLSVGRKVCRPGDVVEAGIRVEPAALADVTLAVRMEVFLDGNAIPAYTKNLAVKGSVTHPIPLALNAKPGEYRIRATEIISGLTQEIVFRTE